MPFEYPRPLVVGGRTWTRFDSYNVLTAGNVVMYKRTPPPMGMHPYDHISMVVGPDGRPKDNELHATFRGTRPYIAGTRQIAVTPAQSVELSLLVFYWDYVASYQPPALALATAGNLNGGRPVKALAQDDSLVSQMITNTAVSAVAAVATVRTSTAMLKNPQTYAATFWSDLLSVQPYEVHIQRQVPNEDLRFDYELKTPQLTVRKQAPASGVIVVTRADIRDGDLSDCSIRFPTHSPFPGTRLRRGERVCLPGGRVYDIR